MGDIVNKVNYVNIDLCHQYGIFKAKKEATLPQNVSAA